MIGQWCIFIVLCGTSWFILNGHWKLLENVVYHPWIAGFTPTYKIQRNSFSWLQTLRILNILPLIHLFIVLQLYFSHLNFWFYRVKEPRIFFDFEKCFELRRFVNEDFVTLGETLSYFEFQKYPRLKFEIARIWL